MSPDDIAPALPRTDDPTPPPALLPPNLRDLIAQLDAMLLEERRAQQVAIDLEQAKKRPVRTDQEARHSSSWCGTRPAS